jgi:hypothetical protein
VALGRDAADGLSRWAAERAPSLLARAEQEAVALLRDALVSAATEQYAPPATEPAIASGPTSAPGPGIAPEPATASEPTTVPEPTTEPPAGPTPKELGELLWAYCVLRDDVFPEGVPGVHPGATVRPVAAGGLVALVSSVPASEFGSEPLRRNLNDLGWLERVARAHEGVLDTALEASTIVPLRMCTLYENEAGVRTMLEHERPALMLALERLEGRWEWAVKVLADEERLADAARAHSSSAQELESALESHGEGGAYLLRRRLDRQLREATSQLAGDVADQVHARLQDWALAATRRPPQDRELSGYAGEMLLNAAYLVERERTGELRELVAELEDRHAALGVRIELSGPWPPYNFVTADGAAAIA